MLSDFFALTTLFSQLFGGANECIHFIMQQKYGANWSKVAFCGRVQSRFESVDKRKASNFSFPHYSSPNGMQSYSCLDSSLRTDVSSWGEVFSHQSIMGGC